MHQPVRIEEGKEVPFWLQLCQKAAQHHVPIEACLELTYGCNLRCVHCYNPTHKAQSEISTGQFQSILDQLAEEGCLQITFTGGEMFTRRDCFDIFAYAKQKGFAITLFTNATMITPATADRIKTLVPKLVEVSIFGATQDTYERVTGVPGSYTLFLRGLGLLRERQVPLLIKMPVMTINQHEVQEAKTLIESWGIKFVYSTEIHPRVDGSREPLQYRLAPSDVVRINGAMHGLRQGYPKGEPDACQAEKGFFHCECGKRSLTVTPYGQMNLCVSLPIPKYDLRSGTVSEGWRTLVALVDGANAKPGEAYECPSCNLQEHCRQGPMNAWLETGNLAPCLPYFKTLAQLEKVAVEETRLTQQDEPAECSGHVQETRNEPGAHR